MKINLEVHKKYIRAGITAFLVIAASLLLYYALFHGKNMIRGLKNVSSVMAPVIYGIGIAFLLIPIAKFL